jgi:hypothetical protein
VAEDPKEHPEEHDAPRDGARPAFADGFPRDPELDALVDAFEAGDFGWVRREAQRIAASATKGDAVKRAAEAVLARTRPDPLQTALLAVSAALLVALSAWWIVHSGKG